MITISADEENSSSNRMAMIVVVLIIVVAAAGNGYWFLMRGGGTETEDTITIGSWHSETGDLGESGTACVIAMEMWAEQVNEEGGIEIDGEQREVEIVNMDSESDPSIVPGQVETLIETHEADILVGGYATDVGSPGVPVAKRYDVPMFGIFTVAANEEIQHDKYFSMHWSARSDAVGFFELMGENEDIDTIASLSVNNAFGDPVHEILPDLAEANGLDLVYHERYPPGTTDFEGTIRSIRDTDPDAVYLATYPVGSTNIMSDLEILEYSPPVIGGATVGHQFTTTKLELGTLLNGIITRSTYAPGETTHEWKDMPEVLENYRERAEGTDGDPLGSYMVPEQWAALQVIEETLRATNSLDSENFADYVHSNSFDTSMGPKEWVSEGERLGEFTEEADFAVWYQFQNIEEATSEEFASQDTYAVLAPDFIKTHDLEVPTVFEWTPQ